MTQQKADTFNVMNLIKCPFELFPKDNPDRYIMSTNPITGILFVTYNNPSFLSGQARARGRDGGRYPFHYLEMIDNLFGKDDNTIEVCSGSINEECIAVDINPRTNPAIVDDGQKLEKIPNDKFSRWRCDPPYNENTARRMYGTDLPKPIRLLEAGARVCKRGSLLFLLLGNVNYMWHPIGVKRIGYINLTIVPNNEVRSLNIFYKYADNV